MMDDQMDRTIDAAAGEYHRPPSAPREEMWRSIEAARRLGGSAAGVAAADVVQNGDPKVLPFRRRAARFAVPIGIAALLALAFGLGRVSVDEVPSTPVVATEQPRGSDLPGAGHDTTSPAGGAGAAQPDDAPVMAPESLELAADQPPRRRADEPLASAASDQPPSRPAAQPLRSQPPSSAPSDALTLAAREHLAQAEAFLVLFRASVNSGERVEPIVPATARSLLASNRLLIDSRASNDLAMRRLLSDVELVLAQIAQMPADSADSTDERLITDGIEQRDLLLRIRTAAGDARGVPNHGVL